MTVKDLMSVHICYVKKDATAADAAKLMKQYDIGFVPVCDNKGCILGLVTDRDIVLSAISSSTCTLSSLSVSDIMKSDIFAVTAETSVHDAACIFAEKKVRRLPVLENNKLVGVLALSDLAKKKIFLAEVGDIMGSIST